MSYIKASPERKAAEALLQNPPLFYRYGIYNSNLGKNTHPLVESAQAALGMTLRGAQAAVVSGVMFGAFSAVISLFSASNMAADPTREQTTKEAFTSMLKTVKTRARSGVRNGAIIGLAFNVAEPLTESRFGHSPFITGFVAGTMVGLRGGPLLTLGSGVGFGAFGYLFEISGMRDKMNF